MKDPRTHDSRNQLEAVTVTAALVRRETPFSVLPKSDGTYAITVPHDYERRLLNLLTYIRNPVNALSSKS